MKNIRAIILLLMFAPSIFASDSPAEISHNLSICAVIPAASNAYAMIPGLGYEFKVIKDSFLFSIGLNANAGIGSAVKDGTDLFGLYKNEWRVPAAETPGRTAVYLRGETAVAFGWNISSFFQRRQFITLAFSALFEREDIGGRVFSKLGRYSSCFSVSTEAFELFGSRCLLSLGYGSVSYSDLGKPGSLGSYIKAGLSMEFSQAAPGEELYKRGPGQEDNGKPEEGGTVW